LRSFKTFYHIVLSCTLFAGYVLVYIFATKNLTEKSHSQIWPHIGFCRELNSLQDALYESSRFFDLKKYKVKNYKKSVFRANKWKKMLVLVVNISLFHGKSSSNMINSNVHMTSCKFIFIWCNIYIVISIVHSVSKK
jgi:hypothetical protein